MTAGVLTHKTADDIQGREPWVYVVPYGLTPSQANAWVIITLRVLQRARAALRVT